MHGIGKSGICFQITEDGRFCLGWGNADRWNKLPFDFNAHIVAEIVKQHLAKQEYNEDEYSCYDGYWELGEEYKNQTY